MEATRGKEWRRWTLVCGVAEFAGIGVAAATIVLTRAATGEPVDAGGKVVTLAAVVAAAVVEGTLVGLLQWTVLRRRFPHLRARAWVTATVVPAAVLWFLGMLVPTLAAGGEATRAEVGNGPPEVLQVVAGAVGGAVAGAAFGTSQWVVLRHHARGSPRWIWANALGWTAGMAWIFVAATIPGEDAGVAAVAVLGAGGGLLGGLSVGAVTGLFLVRLDPSAGREPDVTVAASAHGPPRHVPPPRQR